MSNKRAKIANGLLQTTLGALLIKNSIPSIAGYQKVYHGTRLRHKDSILEKGILTSYGGNRQEGAHQFNKDRNIKENNPVKAAVKTHGMDKRSKGAVFVTPDKAVAQHFADVNSKKDNNNGVIIEARIPVEKWKMHFVADPDQDTCLLPDKMRAARGDTDILPVEISGSKVSKRKKVEYIFSNLPDYIKNNQKEFIKGNIRALAGVNLIGNGIALIAR